MPLCPFVSSKNVNACTFQLEKLMTGFKALASVGVMVYGSVILVGVLLKILGDESVMWSSLLAFIPRPKKVVSKDGEIRMP